MLDRLKTLLDRPGDDEEALHLAAAALLVEAARTDDRVSSGERARIVALARRRFKLTEREAEELLAMAIATSEGPSHLYDHAQTIIDRCPPERRVWIIEMLWEVAYADGAVDHLEASILRRVGGLLAVPDVERGAARLRVRERLGLPDDSGIPEGGIPEGGIPEGGIPEGGIPEGRAPDAG